MLRLSITHYASSTLFALTIPFTWLLYIYGYTGTAVSCMWARPVYRWRRQKGSRVLRPQPAGRNPVYVVCVLCITVKTEMVAPALASFPADCTMSPLTQPAVCEDAAVHLRLGQPADEVAKRLECTVPL